MPATAVDRLHGLTGTVAIKPPCRCATTENINLRGLQTIDGELVEAGDRVLVKDQSNNTENGIYEANTSRWSRAPDFNGTRDVVNGTLVVVRSGTTNDNSIWELQAADPVLIGTDAVVFGRGLLSSSASMGFTQSGAGAVERDAQSKMREVQVSIRDFGAVGGEDSTAAINEAITYAASIDAECVIPPDPNGLPYLYTEIVNKGVLRGTGGVLKLKDGTCADAGTLYYTLHNFDGASRTVMLPNCRYLDLIVDGNSANNTAYTVADALTAGGENIVVRGCRIFDAPDSGIMFTFPINGLCSENQVIGARDVGIYINDNETAADNIASMTINNVVRDCETTGIALKRGMRGHVVRGNYIYNCGNGITHEFFGTGLGGWPKRCVIADNHIEKIGYPHRAPGIVEVGIYLGKFDNGVCQDNYIYDVSGNGINVDGDNWTVSGNKVFACDIGNVSPTALNNCGIITANRATFSDSTGELNDNSVRGFRDNALRLAVGRAFIDGGYYGSTASALYVNTSDSAFVTGGAFVSVSGYGIELAAGAQDVVMKKVVAEGDGGSGAAYAFDASATYSVYDSVDLERAIYDFTQIVGMPKSKSSGTAVIAAATGITITHGLRLGPNKFSLVPTTDSYWWVEAVTSTQFTIRTALSGNYTVYWTAEV